MSPIQMLAKLHTSKVLFFYHSVPLVFLMKGEIFNTANEFVNTQHIARESGFFRLLESSQSPLVRSH